MHRLCNRGGQRGSVLRRMLHSHRGRACVCALALASPIHSLAQPAAAKGSEATLKAPVQRDKAAAGPVAQQPGAVLHPAFKPPASSKPGVGASHFDKSAFDKPVFKPPALGKAGIEEPGLGASAFKPKAALGGFVLQGAAQAAAAQPTSPAATASPGQPASARAATDGAAQPTFKLPASKSAALALAKTNPGAFKAAQQDAALATLRLQGVVVADPSKIRFGIPKAVLADPLKVGVLLGGLREQDRVPGRSYEMRRAPSQLNDQETQQAVDQLATSGQLASLTAGDALADPVLRRTATMRCTQASLALDAQELNLRSVALAATGLQPGSPDFWTALEALNPGALRAYRTAAQRYTQACLDADLSSLTPLQRQALSAVVGYLHVDGVPACMGARVAVDRFLTARHCLYVHDDNLGWLAREPATVTLSLAGNSSQHFDVQELNCTAAQPDRYCSATPPEPLAADHLLLRIVMPKPAAGAAPAVLPPLPAMALERPARNQMLVVPGQSSWITGRAWQPSDKLFVTAPAISGCVVAELAGPCVVNGCQSEAGFSGTPMFARRKVDHLVMVGIFLGTATVYNSCKRSDRNFGASLPQRVHAVHQSAGTGVPR